MPQRIWIDLANSPHVALFGGLTAALHSEGWEVVLTARNHAQTLELARRRWPDIAVIGGESPAGRWRKGAAILVRAEHLRRFARRVRPDVALSHGSYAQILASFGQRLPAVTMMDYEHQPANHLSFRLASRVIVPSVFPDWALRSRGASREKVVRYPGFKEQLYLTRHEHDTVLLKKLGVDPGKVLVVMRTPPAGALYHRDLTGRFEEILEVAAAREDVAVVLLPRGRDEARHYEGRTSLVIPSEPVEGPRLLGVADLVIGGGGTMTREAAILGVPTYTVFAGRLAAVDRELMRRGVLMDLRTPGVVPQFVKRSARKQTLDDEPRRAIERVVLEAVSEIRR